MLLLRESPHHAPLLPEEGCSRSERGGGRSSLIPLSTTYSPLAGPGDFLLLAQNKVTKEKGVPGSPPLPRVLVRFSCAARQSGAPAQLARGICSAISSGGGVQRQVLRTRSSPSARRRPPALAATARRRTGAPKFTKKLILTLFTSIETPAKGRVAGSIEILVDADPRQGGMVTYMLL